MTQTVRELRVEVRDLFHGFVVVERQFIDTHELDRDTPVAADRRRPVFPLTIVSAANTKGIME